jgi:hypothetical protein
VVDFWYQGAVEGYALEFAIECHQCLPKALKFFMRGPRRKLIKEILVWIKMLMVERGMLPSLVEMEVKTLRGVVE